MAKAAIKPLGLNAHAAAELRATIDDHLRLAAEQTAPAVAAAGPGLDPGKAAVEITTDRHLVLAEAVAGLALDAELYTRGANLGVVIREAGPSASLPGGVALEHAGAPAGSSRWRSRSSAAA